jgi:hypothetical protein
MLYIPEALAKVFEVLNIALDGLKFGKKLFVECVVHLCNQGMIIS